MTRENQDRDEQPALPSLEDAMRLALYGGGAAAALYMADHAIRYSVPVPSGSDWGVLRLLENYSSGRIGMPGLVVSAAQEPGGWLVFAWNCLLWRWTGVQSVAAALAVWAVGVLLCVLLWALARRGAAQDSLMPAWVFAAACFFVFHPAGNRIWLNGALTAELAASALAAAIALTAACPNRRRGVVLALSVAWLTVALPGAWRFVTGQGGQLFSSGYGGEAAAGLLTFGFFAALVSGAHRVFGGTRQARFVWVWITLGVYSILAGQWKTSAAFLPVSVVALSVLWIEKMAEDLPARVRAYTALTAALAAFAVAAIFLRGLQTERSVALARHAYFTRLAGSVAFAAANEMTLPQFRYVFPEADESTFRELAAFASRKGWVKSSQWDGSYFRRIWQQQAGPASDFGNLESAQRTPGGVSLSGWAYLAERSERAHGVLLLGEDETGSLRLLSVAWPETHRPDVQQRMRTPESLVTGWRAEIPADRLAGKRWRVRAFAYNALSGQGHPMTGTLELKP